MTASTRRPWSKASNVHVTPEPTEDTKAHLFRLVTSCHPWLMVPNTAQAERASIVAFIRHHATRIAEADRGEQWPTGETCNDVGLLVALAVEIEQGAHEEQPP